MPPKMKVVTRVSCEPHDVQRHRTCRTHVRTHRSRVEEGGRPTVIVVACGSFTSCGTCTTLCCVPVCAVLVLLAKLRLN